MFPMGFELDILSGLPFPDDETVRRVVKVVKALVFHRILPDFRNRRGTEPALLARVTTDLVIERLEDDTHEVPMVSVVCRRKAQWVVQIHERVFDYFAFVFPSDPKSPMGGGGREEKELLAFAEFMLRHQIEHIIYPNVTEDAVLVGDLTFLDDRRRNDPTFYQMLRGALADEMKGLRGDIYLKWMDRRDLDSPMESILAELRAEEVNLLARTKSGVLESAFPILDPELMVRVLGECFRRSQHGADPLFKRTLVLEKLIRLFACLKREKPRRFRKIFDMFRERWGLQQLFRELQIDEQHLSEKGGGDLFDLFSEAVDLFMGRIEHVPPSHQAEQRLSPKRKDKPKTLQDRIEEARRNPAFSDQALQLIEKNKQYVLGHSGAKYSELIETLFAIPWGRLAPVDVLPQDFESGLQNSHYGLRRPKEAVCDFFHNLILRYHDFDSRHPEKWRRTGGVFLFVGPPGVGKTSLAISIASNLRLPYHKISLGGMRDESDLRGHGFTYEGSKPGAIVQGLIKMGVMNGIFILDEADKTEKFAIATLLEILDPEQNHLFHDKYTQSTVDIDLSNCHFILTANTLDTVPPAVIDRCEVIGLDRYSVDEKVAIACHHLLKRIRSKYRIGEDLIDFAPGEEKEVLRHLVRNYTYEAGVRDLERLIRTLFLRIQRKEIAGGSQRPFLIDRHVLKEHLEPPVRPWRIHDEDRVGEALGLGVNVERGVGSVIPIQATQILADSKPSPDIPTSYLSMVHATGNIQRVMDESRKVATTGILHCSRSLGLEPGLLRHPIHLHFMGGSTPKDGPSAGGAIALALVSALTGRPVRRDVAMTGEIDTRGRILPVGGIPIKLDAAINAGCRTLIVPEKNLAGTDGLAGLPEALKEELQILTYAQWRDFPESYDHDRHRLQVVAVKGIDEAARIALINLDELEEVTTLFEPFAERLCTYRLHYLGKATEERGKDALLWCVKSPEELDPSLVRFIRDAGESGTCCRLLCWEKSKDVLCGRVTDEHLQQVARPFDPRKESLMTILGDWTKELLGNGETWDRMTIIAPYFFLVRDGILDHGEKLKNVARRVILCANNFTWQRIKVKALKPLMNRVWALMAHGYPALMDAAPFVARRRGIYVVDLCFVPERYRLEPNRAQDLLGTALDRFVTLVDR